MAHNYKRKAVQHKHWWMDIIWVLLLSIAFLLIAIIIRFAVGLSVTVPANTRIEFWAWVLYTTCWLVFVIAGHSKQDYAMYFPYTGLVIFMLTVANS